MEILNSDVRETNNTRKYHKETFDKISEKKRNRILKIATTEFAEKGFKGANINVIASKSKISIGSMYNYFSTKEHLFLTVIDEGYKLLEKALADADLGTGSIFDKLETLLRVGIRHSREYPEFIQLYLDITSEGLSHLSKRLSQKIENISSSFFYKPNIEAAIQEGIVRPDIDVSVASFCIDNIIMMIQFSYTSEYYKERLRTFIGADALDNDERIIKGVMDFMRGALGVKRTGA